MSKHNEVLLASFFLLCLACTTIVQVKAQGSPFEVEILPSRGDADTTILLRFRTTNATVGNVDKADIFWDDSAIELNQQAILGADGSYNYNLTIPPKSPLSDVGNHTIRVDSTVFNYGQVSFNFTFTVTEFVPSPEYLTLNATYYSLLTNYSDLLSDYNQLLANYTKTLTDHATLLKEYDQLLLNYNSLTANYNSLTVNSNTLTANYNSLVTNYNYLQQSLNSLLANYTSLQTNFRSLSSDYDTLRQDYDSLNSSYYTLRSNNDALGQLTFSRDLNYIFIGSTAILAMTIIYFVTRKPKTSSKTRY